MKRKLLFILLFSLVQFGLFAQKKIDTDSLLTVTNHYINIDKNYVEARRLGHLGLRLAPAYYDFHIALGRTCRATKELDSAAYYFKKVISLTTKYKEAYVYLAQIEIENNKINDANAILDQAINLYPADEEFYWLKLNAVEMENDDLRTLTYLKQFELKFPNDSSIKSKMLELKLQSNSDRLGIGTTLTTFDRAGVGPWFLSTLQYLRQRKKVTLIGRINYSDRASYGKSIENGTLSEIESYVQWNKKHYSFLNIGIGSTPLFPKLRLNYSSFINIAAKWETELGIRYNKNSTTENYSTVLGCSTYIGSGWLNLKSYLNMDSQKKYPSLTLSYRYYLNSRYDYYSTSIGYGTSPDERETLSQYEKRIALNSYRIGLGYSKILFKKYILNLQGNYNRQEYFPKKYQNELSAALQLQYLF